MRAALLAFALLAGSATTSALAQTGHNTNAPINFGADHIELQDRANRAVLSGNVSVVQAEMTLAAARMTVAYKGQALSGGSPQATRIDASGGVTVRRPDQTARASYGIYDLNRRVITMLGAVSLTQAGSTINGGRLTINLDTGRAVIDGSSVGSNGGGGPVGTTAARGGRVTGTFSVPDRQ